MSNHDHDNRLPHQIIELKALPSLPELPELKPLPPLPELKPLPPLPEPKKNSSISLKDWIGYAITLLSIGIAYLALQNSGDTLKNTISRQITGDSASRAADRKQDSLFKIASQKEDSIQRSTDKVEKEKDRLLQSNWQTEQQLRLKQYHLEVLDANSKFENSLKAIRFQDSLNKKRETISSQIDLYQKTNSVLGDIFDNYYSKSAYLHSKELIFNNLIFSMKIFYDKKVLSLLDSLKKSMLRYEITGEYVNSTDSIRNNLSNLLQEFKNKVHVNNLSKKPIEFIVQDSSIIESLKNKLYRLFT